MSARDPRIDEVVRAEMDSRHILGMSVAVVEAGEIAYLRAFGQASPEWDLPASTSQVYQLASLNKALTATAVMILVERGIVRPDTPVGAILDAANVDAGDVQIRHLLGHTSGLADLDSLASTEEASALDVTRAASRAPREFAPGTNWSYNQTGYVVLGALLESVTGSNFAELMADTLFRPLGMDDTTYGGPSVVIKNRNPLGVRWTGDWYENSAFEYPAYVYPAAGLNSTAGDLARFTAALDGGSLLSLDSLSAMWTPFERPDGSRVNYGLGWSLDPKGVCGVPSVGHEGGGRAGLTYFQPSRLGVIVLSNTMAVEPDAIADSIAETWMAK